VIAEIKVIHIGEQVLNENNKIDPAKLDLVARLGDDWYARVTPESLFQVEKPNTQLGIGFDQLPASIRNHPSFSGNEKAQLANVSKLPDGINSATLVSLSDTGISSVKEALQRNEVATAWAAIQNAVLHQ
jgi:hypothetical protein